MANHKGEQIQALTTKEHALMAVGTLTGAAVFYGLFVVAEKLVLVCNGLMAPWLKSSESQQDSFLNL